MRLRPYQDEALAAIDAAHGKGARRVLVTMPTGSGKTILFAEYLRRLLARPEGPSRVLVLAHRDELIEQAVEKLSLVIPRDVIGVVKAERNEVRQPVLVASVQTLSIPHRMELLPEATYEGVAKPFAAIVTDEAHHSAAPTYQRIYNTLTAFQPRGPLMLGVTATPSRHDKKALGETWQEMAYHVPILTLIKAGYLCDIRALRVKLAGANFSKLKVAHGEYIQSDTARMLLKVGAPERVAQAIYRYGEQRRTIVFTPTVEVAQAIETECLDLGIPTRHVSGETDEKVRRQLRVHLRKGVIRVVPNCAVWTEGFDEPAIACITVAKPTRSEGAYQQMVGRGFRPHPDKDHLLLIDMVGATHEHSLMTASALFRESMNEEQAEAFEKGEMGLLAAVAQTEAKGKLTAEEVDVWKTRPFAWIKSSFGYVLGMGERENGWIVLEETPKGWNVVHLTDFDRELVWAGNSLGYAQGIAEDYVRDMGGEQLVQRSARWRRREISDNQKIMAGRWRIQLAPSWKMGDAADAITKAIASVRWRATT